MKLIPTMLQRILRVPGVEKVPAWLNSTLGTIVTSLQRQLQMQSNLDIFGQEMTTQLDNFLQQNHYYPYGPPSLALV